MPTTRAPGAAYITLACEAFATPGERHNDQAAWRRGPLASPARRKPRESGTLPTKATKATSAVTRIAASPTRRKFIRTEPDIARTVCMGACQHAKSTQTCGSMIARDRVVVDAVRNNEASALSPTQPSRGGSGGRKGRTASTAIRAARYRRCQAARAAGPAGSWLKAAADGVTTSTNAPLSERQDSSNRISNHRIGVRCQRRGVCAHRWYLDHQHPEHEPPNGRHSPE